jgi:hypothetical protein
MYEPRWYREAIHQPRLKTFTVTYRETDLWVGINAAAYSPRLVDDCHALACELYNDLQNYLLTDPGFATALVPYSPQPGCPALAAQMAAATAKAGVGPMAAVAGAFAQEIGGRLRQLYAVTDIIVENGGDIYLYSAQARRISIWAGASVLSGKLALEIAPDETPLGICTSSGTVGHSLSFGKADAVTILARDAAVADAYATAVGNMVKTPADIAPALAYTAAQPDISGAVIIIGDRIGFDGAVKLVKAQL